MKKTLEIIDGYLYDWETKNESPIPNKYALFFSFHGEEVKAAFSTKELRVFKEGGYLECSFAETESDLLDSFEAKLEEDEVAEEICKYCETLWKDTFNEASKKYNYLGYLE
jgi:hypothetical protein